MPPIKIKIINTSNEQKADEFKKLLTVANYQASAIESIEFKKVDLEEVEDTPEIVAGMKAVMASQHHKSDGVLIDDTSLDIEDAPNVGINIRWLLDNQPEKFNEYLGRNAIFRCVIAIHDNGTTYIAKGEVSGKIVAKQENPNQKSFGFDPVFQPNGADKTLAQEKPDQYNARYLALKNLVEKKVEVVLVPQPDQWRGQWQQHSFFGAQLPNNIEAVSQLNNNKLIK